MNTRLGAALLITILSVALAPGQTPLGTAFTYQGRLENAGSPASGVHDLRFRLYDALSGGAQVGAAVCFNNVSITDGLFTVPLDFGAQFIGQERFLEIDVRTDSGRDCTNAAGFILLNPRQVLTAAPNALNADRLDGLDSAAFLQSIPNPLTLIGTSATHIIRGENTSAAFGASGVYGATTAASGANYGVFGQSASTSGHGVTGVASAATGATYGVYAESESTSGRGVFGLASAGTGVTYGGRFESGSTSGFGVFGAAGAPTGTTYGGYGESASTTGRGVYGDATAASGFTYGGRFHSASTNGRAVYGDATATSGETFGGRFHSASIAGRGVYGVASATSGATYGVWGQSASNSGRGVYGEASAATGSTSGVYGESASTGGTGVKGVSTAGAVGVKGEGGYGVYGSSTSTTGQGVVGLASAATGDTFGVLGQSASTDGRGVYGLATAATGDTVGVYGRSDSDFGAIGVFGEATATDGRNYGGRFISNSDSIYGVGVSGTGHDGVSGTTDSPGGYGVFGSNGADSGSSAGVHGRSSSPDGRGVRGYAGGFETNGIGVWGGGESTSTGYGVYASGDFGASGSKSFRIDHPDDPTNKYLLHYCAESPEVINFYSETVTLDERGEAVVELPHYFAKINTRPRYQLTAVGAPMPMLHVAAEIDPAALSSGAMAEPGEAAPICSFRIAGGVPGAKVSWEVKAVRNDRWAQKRGARVEVEKQGLEKGKYQHPELYGQPPEKGMDYDAQRERTSPQADSKSKPS